jgi:hypothetical protein
MKVSRFAYPLMFVLMFVALALVAFQPVQTPDSSQHAKDVVEDVWRPGIMPIVLLSGSDYEMGFQYGQQAGHLIERHKESVWAFQTASRETVLHDLKAVQYYAKKYTPEAIDQMYGMVDGATEAGYDVSYTDLLLINTWVYDRETHTFPPAAEGEVIRDKGCSVASAWGSATKTGQLIALDAWDGIDTEPPVQLIIVAFPDQGNSYITRAWAGEIGSHFMMNNRGLLLGNSGGGASRPMDYDFGLSWMLALPHVARFADDAIQARDMFLSFHILNPENFQLVDVHGNAFVVEKTSAIQAVREPGDFGEVNFLFQSNNFFSHEMSVTKEGDFVGKVGGYGAMDSVHRNMLLWDMLHNYHGQIDDEFMKMILRFSGDGSPHPATGEWQTKVLKPSNSLVAVLMPDDGDEGVVHINEGPAGRVAPATIDPEGWRGAPYYIDVTNTFFTLKLAASPREVVLAAKLAAHERISSAYAALMPMRLTDVGFKPLHDLYVLAMNEYGQAATFLNKGTLSGGHEANFYLARAATAYARAQVHASQLTEALAPPPTTPSDLGLKPFGGDWATWETTNR